MLSVDLGDEEMGGQLKITLVRSMAGQPRKHRRVVEGLGLRKMHGSVVREDTDAIRGMVTKISHMLKVETLRD